jgi:hypothetical protein
MCIDAYSKAVVDVLHETVATVFLPGWKRFGLAFSLALGLDFG